LFIITSCGYLSIDNYLYYVEKREIKSPTRAAFSSLNHSSN